MRRRRVLVAALLLATALAGLLLAWFASGWADVQARQRELATAPTREAERTGEQVAHDLRGELTRLINRETGRPYYHYGNLFHDPKAGNWSVAPSPLAVGPGDSLIAGHFQIDATGRVTTPTINDEVPELSETAHLAANGAFRDEVRDHLAKQLVATGNVIVAQIDPKHSPQNATQVVQIDPSTYAQNNATHDVFIQQQAVRPPPIIVPQTRKPSPVMTPDKTIPITISAFEWRTEAVSGSPTLVAVRHVDTPDGRLVQGFVVDRASIKSWLDTRAGALVVRLAPTGSDAVGESTDPEVAPGWTLSAAPTSAALATSASAAAEIAGGFLLRFIVVGVIAAITFAFVVLLVARAEQLARERSQFAAAAAHELRTPLAGLQLYGDMLADGLGDPGKLSDYARRMSEEASRLGRVVSNVLGFSQLERGNLSIDARPGDLAGVLRELVDRTQPALDRAGAVLDLDVPPDLRATFDRDALTRIVGNLLDNAEKYGRDAADRTISVSAKKTGDGVEIVVSDHGPGVTERARAKLFTAFTRGVTGDGPAGLGLGLALSRSLARAMGGDLEHVRKSGGGASFVLRLES